MSTSLRACLAVLALACAAGAHANPRLDGLYLGEIGPGNKVLVSLRGGPAANPGGTSAGLSGEYHYARIWSQDRLQLAGEVRSDGRVAVHETLAAQDGRHGRSGEFKGEASPDGGAILGTWSSADGRRSHAFGLVRAAEWVRQSVKADRGVRTCVRPRFFDPGYDKLNRELAEACDYFLADGREGPGFLSLEIDSFTGPVVAAVAYATSGGAELPPEVITVDLTGEGGSAPVIPTAPAAVAVRR